MSKVKEALKEQLNSAIDLMDEDEAYELLNSLRENELEDNINELIAIRGELKKLTKTVYKLIETQETQNLEEENEIDIKPLINFHQFLINSNESIENLPKISRLSVTKFKISFYAFKQGFSDINILYTKLLEHFEIFSTAGVGIEFDPKLHEAIEIEENKNFKNNIIREVYEQGYKNNQDIIKYAKVKVNRIEPKKNSSILKLLNKTKGLSLQLKEKIKDKK